MASKLLFNGSLDGVWLRVGAAWVLGTGDKNVPRTRRLESLRYV